MTKKRKRSGFTVPRYEPEIREAMRKSGQYGGGGDGEKVLCHEGPIIRAKIKVHYPPDAGAALNWLKNRQPKKWRDKTEQVVSTPDSSKPFAVIHMQGKPEGPKDEA